MILNIERGIITNTAWINDLVSDGELETAADREKLLQMLNSRNAEEVWVANPDGEYPILKWQLSK